MAPAEYAAGVDAYKAGDWDLAIQHFTESVDELKIVGAEDDPAYAPYYMMLGQSFSKAGQIDKSIEPLKQALKLKSGDVGNAACSRPGLLQAEGLQGRCQHSEPRST